MSLAPWHADRELDAASAAETVAAQFPQFKQSKVEFLASGWDNDCFLFDEEWVFRFPRRKEVLRWVAKEVELLAILQGRLPFAIPRIEFLGKPSSHFPYLFFGYRHLPGVPGDTLEAVDEDALAEDLGRFLLALHSTPEALLGHVDVAAPDWTVQDELRLLAKREALLKEQLGEEAWPHWEPFAKGIEGAPLDCESVCLVHNDLSLEHILFDAGSGTMRAVIDFADAEIACPTHDFGIFYYLYGERFLDRLLAAYRRPIEPQALAAMRRRVHIKIPLWMGDAIEMNSPTHIAKHRRWLAAYLERLKSGEVRL